VGHPSLVIFGRQIRREEKRREGKVEILYTWKMKFGEEKGDP
jgi:hypothetical protein